MRSLTLRNCVNLEFLPPLAVETLDLTGCAALRELPEGLSARNLSIHGCRALERWPASGVNGLERLDMGRGVNLTSLPSGQHHYTWLDIRDCVALEQLPDDLRVTEWLDIGGLAAETLPLAALLCAGAVSPSASAHTSIRKH